MIIYEVNLLVSESILPEFKNWLNSHAKSMIELAGFKKFYIYDIKSSNDKSNFCVHYYIESEFYLEKYFINNANKMKQEGLNLFGNNFSATRRILKSWD